MAPSSHTHGDIEAVRAQSDIVDIIGRYVSLNKKGREYVGVCPFHDDHDPSMRVSPEKQIFKCFVCGAGGNVFTFVQKMEHLSFMESVQKVADFSGVPFALQSPRPSVKQDPYAPLHGVMQTFLDYTGYMLKSQEGASALAYLRERKFSDELLETFQIGYCPPEGQVQAFFKAKKLDPQLLADTGLVRMFGLHNRVAFAQRIVIPIHDAQGQPVGITARKLPQAREGTPKYLNTSQTPIFEKGNLIFNYHRAKEEARKQGYVLLVEGAMDVLGLEKAGLHNGVAMLGTACTRVQMELLARLRCTVRVFYDNDDAGQMAVWKFGQAALQAKLPFVVVQNTLNKDPDEILIAHGEQTLQKVVDTTMSFTDFAFTFLQTQYNLQNYEDRQTYARTMADLIARHADVHEARALFQRLRVITDLDFSGMLQERTPVSRGFQTGKPRFEEGRSSQMDILPAMETGRLQAEKAILAAMLVNQKYAIRFKSEVGYFKHPSCHQLSLYIYEAYRSMPLLDGAALISSIEEEDIRNLLSELLTWETSEISDDLFWDSLAQIKRSVLTEQIKRCDHQLEQLPDGPEKLQVILRKAELIKERNQLHPQERT